MKKNSSYPSDLSDAEWELIAPFVLPQRNPDGGRPPRVDRRSVVNALLYLVRTGCQWRQMPNDFPRWQTVYYYFVKWSDDGTWELINTALRRQVRRASGRTDEPSTAILDAQTVKTTEVRGERGFDGHKLIRGRKRQIVVDSLGLLLLTVVHAASISDSQGGIEVVDRLQRQFTSLLRVLTDQGYKTSLEDWVKQHCRFALGVVARPAGQRGFEVVPQRWKVERSIAWLGRNRRLSKDYEQHTEHSESMIYLASIRQLVRRATNTVFVQPVSKQALICYSARFRHKGVE